MIEFQNVSKKYGKTTAIDHLTFSLREPQIYCLLGRNGAGKTTMMNLISGSVPAGSGTVTVGGKTVRFPVTMSAGQRLVCRDQRHWSVSDAKRGTLARGTLDASLPALASGPTRISFACVPTGRAEVKLVKVYE